MDSREFNDILAAILVLTIVSGFAFALEGSWIYIPQVFLFSIIILAVSVFVKKGIAYALDSDVEHELWRVERYGFEVSSRFKNPKLAGLIVPLFFTIISLGKFMVMPLLTYEARALKHRAARRFGTYSYTEMTDWHNALIGSAGIAVVLILALVTYFFPSYNLEYLTKMATFYAFWNMLPISKLDGAQIFFGSRILYSVLAATTLIFTAYAIIL